MNFLQAMFDDPEVDTLFADPALIGQLLRVEAALARAQAHVGVVPDTAAAAIDAAAQKLRTDIDMAALRASTQREGYPVIELVRQLRARTGGEAAEFVHWGATTQDIMDTAFVLQARDALELLESRLLHTVRLLSKQCEAHRGTLMAGRTHLQQALPVSFGLKVANWIMPLLRHLERLRELRPRMLLLQFGGGAGTLAALDDAGARVQDALATELGLINPPAPWHAQRDGIAEIANWLCGVTGSLGKIAQDVILLAQSEVGEVFESADPNRGGSSTMPQKSNPIASEMILAAARLNPGLLSAVHQAQPHEHERAAHGWQLEWYALPRMFALTGAALTRAAELAETLHVRADRMRANVRASNGVMLAEALSFALTPALGRAEAKRIAREAARMTLEQDMHIVDAARTLCNADIDWDHLRDEARHLGSTQIFIDRALEAARIASG
jgi:3-carboxy-cis,cis-muconate cycloisomerase